MKLRFRTVLEELEAHFYPVQPGSRVHGKSEWKHYGDGTYRFKISLLDLPLPDQSEMDLWQEGHWILRLPVQNRKAKADIEKKEVSTVPAIRVGQVVQIRSGDVILAEGTYQAE